MAKKYNTRLHVLHISTGEETDLFEPSSYKDLGQKGKKRITSEACVHHLWFDAIDYESLGNQIKCNPAIKTKNNKYEKDCIISILIKYNVSFCSKRNFGISWI